MRDRLMNELEDFIISLQVDNVTVKSQLFLILNNYEITERVTELAVCSETEVEKYLKMFLVNKRVAGRTDKTLHQYQIVLNMFFREVGKSPVDITSNDIKFFLANKELKDKVSKTHLKNILNCISSFYIWMVKEEFILKNPLNKVDEIKVPKIKKHAFTEMEIEMLRKQITDLRDKAIFEVLLSTWCRVSELIAMDRDKIKPDGSIEVIGKGQKSRIVYFNAKAQVALNDYLATRTDSNKALFTTYDKPYERLKKGRIEQLLRQYGASANVDNVHPHRFRRTGATMALKKGMPIMQVSKLLGHENVNTTQIYLDISENELSMAHKKYV